MGGVAKAVTSVVRGVTKAVTKTVSTVATGGGGGGGGVVGCAKRAVKSVETAASNIIKNPLPVIETVALTAALGPAGYGLQATTAASVSAAAVSAANGGNVKDIATAAAAGYAGGQVAGMAGTQVQAAGYSQTMAQVAASASGASVDGTLQGLARGQSLDQALQTGLESAFVAGATTASVAGVKSALAQGPQEAGEARLKVPAQGTYQLGGDLAQVPQQTGVTNRIPTGGGVGLVADPSILYSTAYSSRLAPTQPSRATGEGGVQPAYQSAESLITPAGLSRYTSPYRESPDFVPSPLTRTQEELLSKALEPAFGSLFQKDYTGGGGAQTTYSAAQPTKQTPLPVGQFAPGSQALAQALRIGDVGAPIFGADEDKGRKAGWNVESLRYMGDVGEA